MTSPSCDLVLDVGLSACDAVDVDRADNDDASSEILEASPSATRVLEEETDMLEVTSPSCDLVFDVGLSACGAVDVDRADDDDVSSESLEASLPTTRVLEEETDTVLDGGRV